MITIIEKNEILVLHKQSKSIREIVKITGRSRNTVRYYIREFEQLNNQLKNAKDKSQIELIQAQICRKPEKKKVTYKKRAFTKDVEQRFKEIISINEERDNDLGPNKQALTGMKIYRQLKSDGYNIGKTTISEQFAIYKKKHKECFIKQVYDYAERAEFDFHQIKVLIDGKIMVYHQATISCPKTNYIFGKLYNNETFDSVSDAIISFFNLCNGVYKELVFDNLSPVVKRLIIKGEKQYTDDIIKLSNYYGFHIKTCNPRSGNEKGHVENSGNLIRKDLFSLQYKFNNEVELNDYYKDELNRYNLEHSHDFEEEQKYLLQLPKHPYLQCKIEYCKVNSYSFVSIDTNLYSIPEKEVGNEIIAHIFDSEIVFYSKSGELLTNHLKKTGYKEYSVNLMHFIDTLLKKPGALVNSLAFHETSDELKLIYNKHYTTNPKQFLLDYSKDPINFTKLNNDSSACKINESKEIEILSMNQLDEYTKTLNERG